MMGTQRGAPHSRMFTGVKYTLYKEYDALFGGKEQKADADKLKSAGICVRSVHIKKGSGNIERGIYIRGGC